MVLCLAGIILSASASYAKVHVLILSGQNNHDWERKTPLVRQILESSGRFEVAVTHRPESLSEEDLDGVDVIVSMWNAYPSPRKEVAVTEWSDSARATYVDFVEGGGGHVALHAGSSSFYDWEDYFAINLMRWEPGQTSHGRPHVFPVIFEMEHPVAEGLSGFSKYDELWRNPCVHPEARVLAGSLSNEPDGGTGKLEPCVLAGQFGRGRCMATDRKSTRLNSSHYS